MTLELASEISALKQGEHLCLIYDDDPAEQMPALLPFIRQGLEHGEQCVYIVDDASIDALHGSLAAYGIDVPLESDRGALRIWTRREWRQPGEVEPASRADQVRSIIDAALASGFTGIRFAVEMTWALEPEIGVERVRHWEAALNTMLTPDVPARVICQYSRRRLAPAVIRAGLSTHALAVLGADVCRNPYYEAPLLLAGDAPDTVTSESARVDWMISQLRWARAIENEREQRVRAAGALQMAELSSQRAEELYNLEVATAERLRRVNEAKEEFLGLVSHELRTPVTLILGSAELLRRLGDTLSPDDRVAAAADIEQQAARLQRIIDNIFALVRVDGDHVLTLEPVMLRQIINRVVAQQRQRYPERAIAFTSDEHEHPVAADVAYLEQIVWNLLQDAMENSPPAEPVDIDTRVEGNEVVVRVLASGDWIALEDEAGHMLTTSSYAGTTSGDIGRIVSTRLVKAHGGRIWAQARDGGGIEVGFALPVEREAP